MRKIDKIIIHCSDTLDGKSFKASDIDRWHKERGWAGIGYHFVVLLDGTVEEGRDIENAGAHCKGQNASSIGICYIGGRGAHGTQDTRTEEQKNALRELIARLRNEYGNLPVFGHHDFDKKKDCPCFNAKKEYNEN